MSDRIDLIGQRFGRLIILEIVGRKGTETFCKALCDCGNEKIINIYSITRGATKSCGCLNKEMSKQKFTTHGLKNNNARLYGIWENMAKRCRSIKDKDYGGRGIRVCDEWRDFQAFHDWAMENGYADNLTIEREDNNGNYDPSNCRWATRTAQNRNRRNTVFVEYNGRKYPLSELAEMHDIPYKSLWARIRLYGWSVERALKE